MLSKDLPFTLNDSRFSKKIYKNYILSLIHIKQKKETHNLSLIQVKRKRKKKKKRLDFI